MKPEQRARVDWLRDIEAAASRIVADTRAVAFDAFTADERARDSAILRFLTMGEAARYLTMLHPTYAAAADLPLSEMRMMRNRLVHGYFNIDDRILWQAARNEAPDVLARVRALVEVEEAS